MKDYDAIRAEKDLKFKVAGQEFEVHMLPLSFIGKWMAREEEWDVEKPEEFVTMCIDRVADCVADGNGSEQRWRDLCASEDSGPSYGELRDLARWAWEVQTDLPTTQPEPSAVGPGAIASSSKVG